MADVIGALSRKRTRLVERKRRVKTEADQQIAEIDREIAEVDKAIGVVNEAVKDILCKTCGGTGSVRRCDAAGQMDDDTCPDCKGTGVKI